MKQLLILGAGTAGTMAANRLSRQLGEDWRITVVDKTADHHYQPGYLFVPFGIYAPRDVVRPRRQYLPTGVDLVLGEIDVIDATARSVHLADGRRLPYDFLVIATGTGPRPEETPGLLEHEWRRSIFDFYTLDGAADLAKALRGWSGGRLVLNVAEMPIKCPVAPLEFLMLADWFFAEAGIRDRVELVFATPLPGAFTKPKASEMLGSILDGKGIRVESEFAIERVDPDAKTIVSYDGREVPFDLLVTVPVNMGDEAIERSNMGDELNYVPTDLHTLRARDHDHVFVLGDATDLPSSKAGSVAHFQVEGFADNFLRYVDGLELRPTFDGHANCYIESGFGKGILIDFNYDVEPLPGRYPLPALGPFALLEETRANHWGKMMFKWIYWNILLRGKELPLSAEMSMLGKWN